MVRGILAGAALVMVITVVASCEATDPGPFGPEGPRTTSVGIPTGMLPEPPGARLPAPPSYLALELAERFRALAIAFPAPIEAGVCHTQVPKRQRPVPFELDRVEIEMPQEAWYEAQDQTALFQYVLLARNGMILRAVRCRIPRSELARDRVIEHFGLRVEGMRLRGEGWSDAGAGTVSAVPAPHGRLLAPLVLALDGGGDGQPCSEPDPPSYCLPCSDSQNPDPCWEVDGFLVEGGCMNPNHQRNEDGICACWNGSPEDDCYLEWEGEGDFCDEFPDFCPEGGEPGGGGGGGGGGDPDPPEPVELQVTCTPSLTVERGESISCTASVTGGGSFTGLS